VNAQRSKDHNFLSFRKAKTKNTNFAVPVFALLLFQRHPFYEKKFKKYFVINADAKIF